LNSFIPTRQKRFDAISESDPKQLNTYKLCVDGKKINSGIYNQKLGDINLWGNETSSTLNERKIELRNEICTIEQLQEYVDKLHLRDLKFLNDMPRHFVGIRNYIGGLNQCM
jgi:hypothetical protein